MAMSLPETLRGFGNSFASEALPHTLPERGNQPQRCPRDLYAELLSGTSFTIQPRNRNLHTWLYRIRPGLEHGPFSKDPHLAPSLHPGPFSHLEPSPNNLRWRPLSAPDTGTTFCQGMKTLGGAGDPALHQGVALHLYSFNRPMKQQVLVNCDGDFLLVPQRGSLEVRTELGPIFISPHEICLLPRGMRFQVSPANFPTNLSGESISDDFFCRGYVLENFQGHWELPELGTLGVHGLASPQDFIAPNACFEDVEEEWVLLHKLHGTLFRTDIHHSPFDVVAWRGNYVPWKYDLTKFNSVGSLLYDHMDPSRFCVVQVPGYAVGDRVWEFGVLPPRWEVAEGTFRPPPYHRNTNTEFYWELDGSDQLGPDEDKLVAGGLSVNALMTGHGAPKDFWNVAANKMDTTKPMKLDMGIACLAETMYGFNYTPWGLQENVLNGRWKAWQGFPKKFSVVGEAKL